MDQATPGTGIARRPAAGGVLLGFEFAASPLRAVAAAAPRVVAGDRPRAPGAGGDGYRRVSPVHPRAGADPQLFAAATGICALAAAAADRARAANEVDAGRRRALLENAEQVMIADQPLIPLYFYVAKHLVSAQVRGWRDNAMNVVYSKQLVKDSSNRAMTGDAR